MPGNCPCDHRQAQHGTGHILPMPIAVSHCFIPMVQGRHEKERQLKGREDDLRRRLPGVHKEGNHANNTARCEPQRALRGVGVSSGGEVEPSIIPAWCRHAMDAGELKTLS